MRPSLTLCAAPRHSLREALYCVCVSLVLLDLGGVKSTACGDDVALIGCGLSGLGGNGTAYVETGFSSLVLLCEGDISRFSFFEGVYL